MWLQKILKDDEFVKVAIFFSPRKAEGLRWKPSNDRPSSHTSIALYSLEDLLRRELHLLDCCFGLKMTFSYSN